MDLSLSRGEMRTVLPSGLTLRCACVQDSHIKLVFVDREIRLEKSNETFRTKNNPLWLRSRTTADP